MRLSSKGIKVFFVLIGMSTACTTVPAPQVLSMNEKIKKDQEILTPVYSEFKKQIQARSLASSKQWMEQLAIRLATSIRGFDSQQVICREILLPQKFYIFPGTRIYVPAGFIQEVRYENELAAALAFELAQVALRTTTKYMEGATTLLTPWEGEASIFHLKKEDSTAVIELASQILYEHRYSPQALSSFFQRYSKYFDFTQSEVEWMLRESQRVRLNYPPLQDPVVSSSEFVYFKKQVRSEQP